VDVPESVPSIATERLLLRPFMLADADIDTFYQVIHSDPEVMRYLPGSETRTREDSLTTVRFCIEHGETHGFAPLAVMHAADDILLGYCGLMHMPIGMGMDGEVEVAYAIRRDYWGQGLITEAARASLRYGFEEAGLPEILALAVPENVGSRRVMEKLGMAYQGITTRYYGGTELALYTSTPQTFDPGAYTYRLLE
jgi:ribosomal-protein-alanine N-acetyltransferase